MYHRLQVGRACDRKRCPNPDHLRSPIDVPLTHSVHLNPIYWYSTGTKSSHVLTTQASSTNEVRVHAVEVNSKHLSESSNHVVDIPRRPSSPARSFIDTLHPSSID